MVDAQRWLVSREIVLRIAQDTQDRASAVERAGVIVALFEGRLELALDNGATFSIGKGALETVTNLDTDFALVRRDNQKYTVVLIFLSDSPMPS